MFSFPQYLSNAFHNAIFSKKNTIMISHKFFSRTDKKDSDVRDFATDSAEPHFCQRRHEGGGLPQTSSVTRCQ